MSNQKKILLLLPTGMTIRNFLTTKIIHQILGQSSHKIICCVSEPDKYKDHLNHPRLEYVEFHKSRIFNLNYFFIWILRRRFYSIYPNPTLSILEKGPLFLSVKGKLASLLKYPFPRSRLIYNAFKKISRRFYRQNNFIEKQFQELSPDVVFATHLVAKDEYEYLMSAFKRSIPTIGMVKSFDNLTSKGFLPYETDAVIVWNEIMKNEVMNLHNYKNEDIFITGVPQFDQYKEEPAQTKVKFFACYKLDLQKKVILYATNHHDISPDDPSNIEFIAENLDKLGAQLIVRLHQMDNLERYKSFPSRNIIFQIPGLEQGIGSNERVADRAFIKDLRDTLYYSDVTINTASTMSLDAVALDKPVINIAYDFEEKSYFQSVKRYYDFVHYQPIIKSSATSIAQRKEDLLGYISEYIKDPSIKSIERSKLREVMLNNQSGNASNLVATSLLEFIDRHK